jgi:hypothetical protein
MGDLSRDIEMGQLPAGLPELEAGVVMMFIGLHIFLESGVQASFWFSR